ncbi:MAG TPA: hypothetical protein VMV10_09475 [Pirellulales bacterium]|nr:hypothetical protein [Pirellulales bacterium]
MPFKSNCPEGAGVTDIRGHMGWLNDDLACRTVDDRVAMYHKYQGDKFETYAVHHDRVRLIGALSKGELRDLVEFLAGLK